MIIQKMNNALVKHGKVTFTFFTIIIIISFVWYFAPGRDGSMFFGGMRGPGSKYGEVLGKDITVADINDASQALSMYLSAANPYVRPYLDENEAFLAAVHLKAADVLGIQASDREVADRIHTMPVFLNQDGTFSKELYTQYRDQYLKPAGNDYSDLEEAVRTVIRIDKVPMLTTGNVVVSDAEMQDYAEMMLAGISYHRISFSPDSFADQAGDVDAKAYYEANKASYRSLPEYDGVMAYAPYTVQKTVTPDEEQLKAFYDAQKDTLYKNEDGTIRPFDEVKDDIRKKTGTKEDRDEASAKEKLLAFHAAFLTARNADPETYEDDPQKDENLLRLFREEAEKAGLKLATVSNITRETNADPGLYLDSEMIGAITESKKKVGDFTQPIEGDVCASMFIVTGYRPDKELPFEKVREKATSDAIEHRKQELAEKAAADFMLAFKELKNPEERAAGIRDLVTSLNGIWHDETTVNRLQLEEELSLMQQQISILMQMSQNVDLSSMQEAVIASVKAVIATEIGNLSAPYTEKNMLTGKETTEFIFVTAHKPASAEEVAAQKDMLADSLKNKRQSIVMNGIMNWIGGTVKSPADKQNRQ